MNINYQQPSKNRDFSRFNEQQFLEQVKTMNADNHSLYTRTLGEHQAIVKAAAALYGITSKEYKYIRNIDIPKPPNLERAKNNTLRSYQQYLYREIQRERGREKYQRRKEAQATLEEMGYVPNKDFPPSRAIGFLNQIRQERKLNETTNAEEKAQD